MAKEATRLSIRAYAKELHVSDGAVRKAIGQGKIKKGVAYQLQIKAGKEVQVPEIIKEIADQEWGNLQRTEKVKPGQNAVVKLDSKRVQDSEKSTQVDGAHQQDTSEISEEDERLITSIPITADLKYSEVVRRREIIGLVLDKKKLQEVEAILVKRSDVEKALFGFGSELKKALLNVPARITSIVRSAPNDFEGQQIITAEITELLNQFANLSELKL